MFGGATFLSNTLKRRNLLAVTVILIVAVFIVISKTSYAYLEKRVEGSSINLAVDDLKQTINGKVTLAPGKSEKIDLIIRNDSKVSSKYQMIYRSNDSLTDILVGYASETSDLPYGDIEVGQTKNVIITLKNNSEKEVIIEIDVRGGLSSNTIDDINLKDGEFRINQPLDVIIETTGTPRVLLLGSSYTGGTKYPIDISSQVDNYQDLTADHFYYMCFSLNTIGTEFNGEHWLMYITGTKTYDNTTGVLSITPPYARAMGYALGNQFTYPTCSIYCIH